MEKNDELYWLEEEKQALRRRDALVIAKEEKSALEVSAENGLFSGLKSEFDFV